METGPPSSVERLLAAIRRSGDFPAMARTVGRISTLTSSEATSSGVLADTILQDYGLTQKVLRLVNTVSYAQYDEVTTITRAVLLMGFERIRSIASGLVLFEHLRKQARTAHLADVLNMSFYSAILGRGLAEHSGLADGEEAFISALFHRIGWILVAFYLPQDHAAIEAAEPEAREATTLRVLGMTYDALGQAVAAALSLPDKLAQSLVRTPGDGTRRTLAPSERLSCLATLANDITAVLATADDSRTKKAQIDRLVGSYAHQIQLREKVDEIISQSTKEMRDASPTFRLGLPGSRFAAALGAWRPGSPTMSEAQAGSGAEASAAGTLITEESGEAAAAQGADTPDTILTKGLHEVTSLLVGDYSLDDILRVAIETMYRALGVGRTRVFFLLRDATLPVARFRYGFGQSSADMKAWLEIPLSGRTDLFSLAFAAQKDLVVRDSSSPEVLPTLPAWFTSRATATRYLILLPLVVDGRTVGLFYIDGDQDGLKVLTTAIMNMLKVLRGQAVLAIRQKATRSRR